ncbi:MAG: ChaN family lipoprotein [Phycisphaerales bacterium]|nr:ChaN family lipoprotein [Phycisphaerales bacterium]
MPRNAVSCAAFVLSLWLAGCAGTAHRLDLDRQAGGNAALFRQVATYDTRTGRRLGFDEVVRRCEAADVVFFGEEHNDSVCNQYQAQLLCGLLHDIRPTALAMEFFEADTQTALDAYLVNATPELEFREQTRQGRAYVRTHRPLIEIARTARVPVIAANAPRQLVRGYRLSGESFEDYVAGLPPADRRWLPERSEYLTGPYEERFFELMGGHGDSGGRPAGAAPSPSATQPAATTVPAEASNAPASAPAPPVESDATAQPASSPATTQPSDDLEDETERIRRFYVAQLLWDDAMAEHVAHRRRTHPFERVLLIVGGFHVDQEGGTVIKYRQRRPADRTITLVYRSTPDPALPLRERDRTSGDIIVYGIAPSPAKGAEGS